MKLPQSLKRWRDDAVASKSKFIQRIGILGYGGLMGFTFAVIMSIMEDASTSKLPAILGSIVILGPLCGWLWGHSMWKLRHLWKSPEMIAAELKE